MEGKKRTRGQSGSRKALRTGVVASAALLGMAGTAFACTNYVGKVTLTATGTVASGPASGTAVVQGDPTKIDDYCVAPSRGTLRTLEGTFNLTVAETDASVCSTTSKLNPTTTGVSYDVRWVQATVREDTSVNPGGITNGDPNICHGLLPTGIRLGSLTITNGAGSGNFSLLPSMLGAGNICVRPTVQPDAGSGNTVLMNWSVI